jgi:hypothetical protein
MKMKMSRNRGRPRGRHRNVANFTALEYINRISIKYELDLNIFFNCLVEAWQHEVSKCKSFLIKCRGKERDYAIFLITEGSKVIAQFHIPNQILQDVSPLENFISEKKLLPKIMPKVKVANPSIRELKIGMKRINLTGKVTEISKSNMVFSRLGEAKKVANAKLTDGTGFIQLPLWNQQIQTVATGDLIQIKNAYVTFFKGKLQLRIRGSGKLTVIRNGEPMKQPKKE